MLLLIITTDTHYNYSLFVRTQSNTIFHLRILKDVITTDPLVLRLLPGILLFLRNTDTFPVQVTQLHHQSSSSISFYVQIRTIRDGEPRTSTASFKRVSNVQLLSSDNITKGKFWDFKLPVYCMHAGRWLRLTVQQ